MNPYKVIIRPIDTEKARYQASELGRYTFEVDLHANKIDVRRAVEAIYGAEVVSVSVSNMPAKVAKRYGRGKRIVHRPRWKKAVVTVAGGQQLDVFEGA